MKALIGEKIGMTQVFSKEGNCVPVTVLQIDKCVPILRRTQEENGYNAVLVAYGTRKSKHTKSLTRDSMTRSRLPQLEFLLSSVIKILSMRNWVNL